jgi:flagellar basal-body rod protein FlgF
MQSSLYVSLSAQIALLQRLESISNNVANASTAGFRAEEIKFEQLISNSTPEPTAFVSPGITYLSRQSGEHVKTDNPLDVAVKGDAWLSIQTPAGAVYTRDGRMKMTATGELQTLTGYQVLDVGGSPVQLNPNSGMPVIAPDGAISQGNRQIGAIGLFTIPETATLARFENSGVIPSQAGGTGPRLHQVRGESRLRRAGQRQSRHGDLQADHGAARLRLDQWLHKRNGIDVERRHQNAGRTRLEPPPRRPSPRTVPAPRPRGAKYQVSSP